MKKMILTVSALIACSFLSGNLYAECQTLRFQKEYGSGRLGNLPNVAGCWNSETHNCGVEVCFLQQGMSTRIVKISLNNQEVVIPPGLQQSFTNEQQAISLIEGHLETGLEIKQN